MEVSLRLIAKKIKERNNGLEIAVSNKTQESRGAQIGGLNLALESVYGVQIGGLNGTQESRGAQIGGLNFSNEVSYGIQAGGFNISKKSISGAQVGLANSVKELKGAQVGVFNFGDELKGAQVGVFNGDEKSIGVQAGISNYANESSYGVQIGGLNYAKKLKGVQISPLLNFCGKDSKGLQVGLFNIRFGNPWYSTFVPGVAIRTNKKNSLEKKIGAWGFPT